MTFLQNHRFDFNKWAKGIDYLPHSEEAAARVKGRLQALGNALQTPDIATVRRGHDVQLLYRRAYVPIVQAMQAAQAASTNSEQSTHEIAAEIAEGERTPAWTILSSPAASVQVPGHDWVAEAEAASNAQEPQQPEGVQQVDVTLPAMQCVRLGCALDGFPRKMLRDMLHAGSWQEWVAASGAQQAWEDLQQRQAAKMAEAVAAQAAAAAAASSGEEGCTGDAGVPPAPDTTAPQQPQEPADVLTAMPDMGVQLQDWAVDYMSEDQSLPGHGVNRWRKVVRLFNLGAAPLPPLPAWLAPHMPSECTPLQQRWMWWIIAKNAAVAGDKLSAAVGVRQLWDIVAASGKPVAGHNCLLDLLHLSDAFLGSVSAHPHAWASNQVLQQLATGGVYDSKHLLLWMRQQLAAETGEAVLALPAVQLKQALDASVGRGPTGLGSAFAALEALRPAAAGPEQGAEAESEQPIVAAGTAAMQAVVPRFVMQRFKTLSAPGADGAGDADSQDSSAAESASAEAATADEFAHDAAYDAYMTGCIVAHVQELMAALHSASGGVLPQGVAESCGALGSVAGARNTLHVMWSRHASEWCLHADAEWYLEDAAHWRGARLRTLHVDRLNHTVGTRHLVDMANAALASAKAAGDTPVCKDDVIWIDDRSGVVQLPSAAQLSALLQWSRAEQRLHSGTASRWRLASLPCLSAFDLSSWADHVRVNSALYGPLALLEATEEPAPEAGAAGAQAEDGDSPVQPPQSKKPRV